MTLDVIINETREKVDKFLYDYQINENTSVTDVNKSINLFFSNVIDEIFSYSFADISKIIDFLEELNININNLNALVNYKPFSNHIQKYFEDILKGNFFLPKDFDYKNLILCYIKFYNMVNKENNTIILIKAAEVLFLGVLKLDLKIITNLDSDFKLSILDVMRNVMFCANREFEFYDNVDSKDLLLKSLVAFSKFHEIITMTHGSRTTYNEINKWQIDVLRYLFMRSSLGKKDEILKECSDLKIVDKEVQELIETYKVFYIETLIKFLLCIKNEGQSEDLYEQLIEKLQDYVLPKSETKEAICLRILNDDNFNLFQKEAVLFYLNNFFPSSVQVIGDKIFAIYNKFFDSIQDNQDNLDVTASLILKTLQNFSSLLEDKISQKDKEVIFLAKKYIAYVLANNKEQEKDNVKVIYDNLSKEIKEIISEMLQDLGIKIFSVNSIIYNDSYIVLSNAINSDIAIKFNKLKDFYKDNVEIIKLLGEVYAASKILNYDQKINLLELLYHEDVIENIFEARDISNMEEIITTLSGKKNEENVINSILGGEFFNILSMMFTRSSGGSYYPSYPGFDDDPGLSGSVVQNLFPKEKNDTNIEYNDIPFWFNNTTI